MVAVGELKVKVSMSEVVVLGLNMPFGLSASICATPPSIMDMPIFDSQGIA